MRILWLDINASYAHSSLALPSLHAQLTDNQQEQTNWKVISSTINSNKSSCLSEMIDFRPQIIFSTLWLFNHDFTLSLLSKYSSIYNGVTIILGGPEFLGNNEDFLRRNIFVTAVFRGEGEEIFPTLMDHLYLKNEWRILKGFCSINADNSYTDNGEYITENFQLLKKPEDSSFFCWDKPFIQLETSRGCFNSCAFCVSGSNNLVQNLTISEIRERLELFVVNGIKEVRILDRTFNANPKRAVELLSLFEDFSSTLKFHLEIHPALLNDSVRKKLADMPNQSLHLEAGIQSFNNNTLDKCKRYGSGESSQEGLEFLVSLKKFVVHADLIAGLPEYSFSNVLIDINRLIKIGVDEIQLELLKLLPGTEFRNRAEELGLKFSKTPPYEILESNSISFKELISITLVSKILDSWYNTNTWRDIFREITDFDKNFVAKFLSYILHQNTVLHCISQENKALIFYDFCKINYPSFNVKIAVIWLSAGLSLKKGAGLLAKQWKPFSSNISNPLYNPKNLTYKYYYLQNDNNEMYWFVYDNSESRNKPIIIT